MGTICGNDLSFKIFKPRKQCWKVVGFHDVFPCAFPLSNLDDCPPKRSVWRQIKKISVSAPHTRKSLVKGERFIRYVWKAEKMTDCECSSVHLSFSNVSRPGSPSLLNLLCSSFLFTNLSCCHWVLQSQRRIFVFYKNYPQGTAPDVRTVLLFKLRLQFQSWTDVKRLWDIFCWSALRSGDTVTSDRIERCCYC